MPTPVSYTHLLVAQGDVAAAERLLGRPFGFDFEIVRGRQLGRTMGTPTINQVFTEGFVLPLSLIHI